MDQEIIDKEKTTKLISAIKQYQKTKRLSEKAGEEHNQAINTLKTASGVSGNGQAVYEGALMQLGNRFLDQQD